MPGRIAIAGDSAGGGLVAAAMVAIREAGLPQPGCGWCISPWVDMEMTGETMTSKSTADPMVQRDGVSEMARLYLSGADPRSPLAAPIYADLSGLGPLLIQVGAAETLLDDAILLAKAAGAADVRVDLQIWPEMVHVWHLFHPELKAGLRAIEAGGAFARAHTSGEQAWVEQPRRGAFLFVRERNLGNEVWSSANSQRLKVRTNSSFGCGGSGVFLSLGSFGLLRKFPSPAA